MGKVTWITKAGTLGTIQEGKFFKINNDKDKNRKQKFEDYLPEYNNLRNFA